MLFPFSRFIVRDRSMEPFLRPDDRVITYNWGFYKVGDTVVYKNGMSFYIKRITQLEMGKIYVAGDNKKLSAKAGPITFNEIIGRVVRKY